MQRWFAGRPGGCLLPIGDPPLFLGYLRGVPFLWTLFFFVLGCNLFGLIPWPERTMAIEQLDDRRRVIQTRADAVSKLNLTVVVLQDVTAGALEHSQ